MLSLRLNTIFQSLLPRFISFNLGLVCLFSQSRDFKVQLCLGPLSHVTYSGTVGLDNRAHISVSGSLAKSSLNDCGRMMLLICLLARNTVGRCGLDECLICHS